jgi:hypothetical protein
VTWASGAAAAAGPLVAHDASEIPLEWTQLAPPGTCLANPFAPACPKVSSVSYPTTSALRAALRARDVAETTTSSVVRAPDTSSEAAGLQTRTATASSADGLATTAAQAVVACTLTVFTPGIISVQGNYIAHGTSTVQCPPGYIYAEVTSSLYRSGVFLATGTTGDIIPPLFAAATASYDCNHTTARPYANVGLGFVQLANGSAASNTATASANHTCPG